MFEEDKCGGGAPRCKFGGVIMYRKQRFLTGFTLIELLVTIVILTILAGLAIPQYTKSVERGKMREAEANLYTMYMAEKMYKLDNPAVGYIDCDGLSACNTTLGIEMTAEYFTDYKCTTTGTPATTFTCEAKRVSGRYKDCVYQIDQTGEFKPEDAAKCP